MAPRWDAAAGDTELAGFVADHAGRGEVSAAGFALALSSYVGFAFASSQALVQCLFFVMGAAMAFTWAGLITLSVELVPGDEIRGATAEPRAAGLPVVEGQVLWHDPDDYYHYYPSIEQVRAWVTAAGFVIEDDAEGPWHEDGYAYHHVLARRTAG